MSTDFVLSTVRRLNRNLLIISLVGLLLVIIGLGFNTRYLYNVFAGPFPLERDALLKLTNADLPTQYYVTVTGDDHANTGYEYVKTSSSGSETTEAYYLALLIDDKLLLVKSLTTEIENTISGELLNIPTDIQNEVVAEVEREVPEIAGAFLPVMLDTSNFRMAAYIGLGIGALLGLAALVGVGLAIQRFLNPYAHPAIKALERFGLAQDMVSEIEAEMGVAHELVGKKIHFTRGWFISALTGLEAMRYRDVMWGYKQITQHRTYGVPTGKTYAALVRDRFGKDITLTGKEAEIELVLQQLMKSAPAAIIGYSDDLNRAWNKDRAGFIAAVEKRR